MRHLKHNTTPPLDYIDQIIASKKAHKDDKAIIAKRKRCKAVGVQPPADLTYKERCAEIRKRNKDEIEKYKTAFDSDNLAIVPQGIPVTLNGVSQDCEEMDGLYSFHCAAMGKLFVEVLSSDGYYNDMCPVCESVKATTFDHYLPQSQYQLFAVHPLNLIPCCTVCNGHKSGTVFDENNRRKYWNAYLDISTTERFLYCDITEEKGMPKAEFRIDRGNLPDNYFEIVKNTFDGLELNDNYKKASGRVIINLKDSCCKYYIKNQDAGLDNCFQTVADTIPDTNINHWENVLKKALIGTDIFKMFVVTALKQDYGIIVGGD